MNALAYFRHLLRPVPRFEQMIRVLGVKDRMERLPDSHAVLQRAENRCLACSSPEACEGWLEVHDSASQAPGYCRNHDLFARLINQIDEERQPA
jgi:hypothetical protein